MLSEVRGNHLIITSKFSKLGRIRIYLTPGYSLYVFKLTFMDHFLCVMMCILLHILLNLYNETVDCTIILISILLMRYWG